MPASAGRLRARFARWADEETLEAVDGTVREASRGDGIGNFFAKKLAEGARVSGMIEACDPRIREIVDCVQERGSNADARCDERVAIGRMLSTVRPVRAGYAYAWVGRENRPVACERVLVDLLERKDLDLAAAARRANVDVLKLRFYYLHGFEIERVPDSRGIRTAPAARGIA